MLRRRYLEASLPAGLDADDASSELNDSQRDGAVSTVVPAPQTGSEGTAPGVFLTAAFSRLRPVMHELIIHVCQCSKHG